MIPTDRGLRLGPLHLPVDEEVESLHLKLLLNPPITKPFSHCVRRFNANVPYSGLLYSVTNEVCTWVNINRFFTVVMLTQNGMVLVCVLGRDVRNREVIRLF